MGGHTIRVCGGDETAREAMARELRKAGFSDVDTGASLPLKAPAALVVLGADAAAQIAHAREVDTFTDVPILALVPAAPTAPADVEQATLAAGADDVVLAQTSPVVIAHRLRSLLDRRELGARARKLEAHQAAMLRVQELMARGGDAPDVMREVLLGVVDTMEFDRASLIAHIEVSDYAYVVAATDDPGHHNFALAIADYPELSEAIRTRAPVLIDNALTDPITARAADALAAVGVRGIAVFPVVWRDQPLGAVLLRRGQPGVGHLDADRIAFGSLFANMVAATLRHGSMIERLRDQTRRLSRASYEAERRLRTIESLKEHFEASADGIVVLDENGHILFVNGTAEAITGFARDGLVGAPMADLVPEGQREPLHEVIDAVLSGTNLEAFDLALRTTAGGDPICVSVTTSTVLSRSGAVILSFRNVTQERRLESELHQTKDFLENLINSAVDAIIAADMRGQVILFNTGAERICGYARDEVIGRIPVWQLYPDGVAIQVMRMLRSSKHGGVGKLEQTRREIRTKAGELVPVNMTASIIYEDGREVATVGIFSDLRERLRIEQRLLHAQERLELQERQAMVAQLAGAAAHELNQPLTSIMGYTSLIRRNLGPEDTSLRAVNIIERETERMADIVKKIGRITRYETKEYVGSASIMDLDKSAASTGDFPRVITAELPGDEEAFEEEATRQFDPDLVDAARNPFTSLIAHEDDEERTQPSLRIGPYKEAIARARAAREQQAAGGDDGEPDDDRDERGDRGDREDKPATRSR